MTDVQCPNCGAVIASAQWQGKRGTRTRSYHEGGFCVKKREVFRLDRFVVNKENAVDFDRTYVIWQHQNPRWAKFPKVLANIQKACPHRETVTVQNYSVEGIEYWIICKRCMKKL